MMEVGEMQVEESERTMQQALTAIWLTEKWGVGKAMAGQVTAPVLNVVSMWSNMGRCKTYSVSEMAPEKMFPTPGRTSWLLAPSWWHRTNRETP
jgi:hypothetical protein